MLKNKKKDFVAELENIYKISSSVIITHYHGLTVAEVTKLRNNLRELGANFKIVKNTLSKIAANNSGINYNPEMFVGPTAIAYSEDSVAAAKAVVKFAKGNDNLKIVGGIVNNQVLDIKGVKQVATLPSLDELRGTLIGLLQAPATNIARVINTPAGDVARVIGAYAEK